MNNEAFFSFKSTQSFLQCISARLVSPPPPQGVAMEKEEKEKGDITAKNGRREKERLDNEINLPSSLPYRRKHFKKLDVRLFSEELEAYANRYFCDT